MNFHEPVKTSTIALVEYPGNCVVVVNSRIPQCIFARALGGGLAKRLSSPYIDSCMSYLWADLVHLGVAARIPATGNRGAEEVEETR